MIRRRRLSNADRNVGRSLSVSSRRAVGDGPAASSRGAQRALPLPVEADLAALPDMSGYETMLGEYAVMEIHPRSHLMAYLRDRLPSHLTRAEDIEGLEDDYPVVVCGLVVRRQHSAANAIFLRLEDDTGHSPVVYGPLCPRSTATKSAPPS